MAARGYESWRFLSGLLPYLARHKGRLLVGFVCILLTNGFLSAMPWVLKRALDSLEVSVTREKLLTYAALIVGLTILEGVFRFATRWLMIGASRDIEYDLRNDVFEKLETLPLSFYRSNRTGDLMSRATNDLANVRMLLGPGIMYSANTAMTALMAAALMFKISWSLALLAFVPLPFVSYGVRRFGTRIHQLTEEAQSRLADLSARVQESMAGVRVVKAFVQERREIDDFERMNLALVSKNNELIGVTSVFYPIMQFTIGLAAVIVLLFGGWQVVNNAITFGDFVAFTVYLGYLAWPMIALGWVVNLLERGRASMERLNYILDAEPEIHDAAATRDDFAVRGEIEFRNLTFAYNGEPVLRGISLKIPAGKTMAIVGATGSGKSTLVQLIPRLYNPPPHTLFIDGVPVEEIPLERLRRAIGFIPQDTFLFGETIRENIAFGVDDATDEEVTRAARISSIDIDIEEFPDRFATVVGERGITLSGGQKQRTAISRAVIRDPKILILDDALSSVDTYTEERILEELKRVMHNRTSILISHRVSTVKAADEIIVLDAGAIVERGSHEALIRRGGYYAELHRRQLLEEELAVSE
jgi:ATP-binding cassette subfamily B protein